MANLTFYLFLPNCLVCCQMFCCLISLMSNSDLACQMSYTLMFCCPIVRYPKLTWLVCRQMLACSAVRCPIPTWPVRCQTLTYFAQFCVPLCPFVQNNPPPAFLCERKQICELHENICILWKKTCFEKRQSWQN